MKNQKGITLIALIITIIIMLILVGVSVTVALNGGLFKTAKQASEKTEEKKDEELALSDGKVNVNGKLYNSMDEYVNGEKWTQNETTITKGDTTLEIGQKVTGYDAGVEGWDGEWAVLGVEDGKLLLVSTKSVAYDSTNGYGTGTVYFSPDETYINTLQSWCEPFKNNIAESIRPLCIDDICAAAGENSTNWSARFNHTTKTYPSPISLTGSLYSLFTPDSEGKSIALATDINTHIYFSEYTSIGASKWWPIIILGYDNILKANISSFYCTNQTALNIDSSEMEGRAAVTLGSNVDVDSDGRINSES